MDSELWKKLNSLSWVLYLLVVKLLLRNMIKRFSHFIMTGARYLLKRYQGVLVFPSILMAMWFPISFGIDCYLVTLFHGLAIWWCVVDVYCAVFFFVILKAFFNEVKASEVKANEVKATEVEATERNQ